MSKENMCVISVVGRAGMLWRCTGTFKTSTSYSGWYDKRPPRNGKEEIVFIWVQVPEGFSASCQGTHGGATWRWWWRISHHNRPGTRDPVTRSSQI